MINTPKINKITSIGIAKSSVTSATNGFDTPYPTHPPPERIAVESVPTEPLKICTNAVAEIKSNNAPIVIRPVSLLLSGTRKIR